MRKLLLFAAALFAAQFSQAQWEPDVRLTNDPDTSQTSHNRWCIAAVDDFVHVVWYDNRDGNREIYYKRSLDEGITWESDIRLTIMPEPSRNPSIAVSGTDVHIGWEDYRDGNGEIYYKRSTDGGLSWGEDIRLTDNPATSTMPSISVSGAVVHMVWHDFRDGNAEIYYKRSTDGGLGWETDVQLTDHFNHSYLASITTSGPNVHVVWNDFRDGNLEIYYKSSTDEGASWGPDTRLTDAPLTSNFPSIAVSGTDIHVAWEDWRDSSTGAEIYYKRSLDGGMSWEEDTRLTEDQGNSIYTNIAVSGPVLHVVWKDNREGNYHIYYKRSEDGGENWGADTLISGNGIMSSQQPSVAVSGSAVHMVWYDDRDGNYEIYYKRNPTGGFPVAINNELTGNNDQSVNIYPNPASSIIHIQFNETPAGISLLTIWNILGEQVISEQIQNDESLVDVSILQNGIYMVEVTTYDGKGYSQKLIIQK